MTATRRATTHRVVCADWKEETTGLAAAQAFLFSVETGGACRELHTIEVRDGDEWVPLHIALARQILAAGMGATIETLDGRLVKAGGSWSKEAGDRADAVADPMTDPAGWCAALGPHEEASLTADGRGVRVDLWCHCITERPAETWTRYERWTAEGRVAHGYACPTCRHLIQAG